MDVQKKIKTSKPLQKSIFLKAGILGKMPEDFQIIEETDPDWALKYKGKRDIFYKDSQGKGVVLEVCFDLTCDHIHKDFKYLMDANLRDKVSTMLWLCDNCDEKLAQEMIEDYGKQLGILSRVDFIILKPRSFFLNDWSFDIIFENKPPKQTPIDGIILKLTQKADKNKLLLTKEIADIIGTVDKWVRGKTISNSKFPILKSIRNPDNKNIGSDNNAFNYKLADVITFVNNYQIMVTNKEKLTQILPLFNKKEDDISKIYIIGPEIKHLPNAIINPGSIKKRLKGKEKGFCIGSNNAYDLLYLRSDAIDFCTINVDSNSLP